MSYIEGIYNLLEYDEIKIPTKDQDIVFLKKKEVSGKTGPHVHGLDHKEQLLLGQLISEKLFPNGEYRYTLLGLQKSYDLFHSTKTSYHGKILKNLTDGHWFYNKEVILEEGKIIPDPVVIEVDEELVYDGKIIEAEINTKNVFDTLIGAGLLKEADKKIEIGHIHFNKEGESCVSVSSYDVFGEPRIFFANSTSPNDHGIYSLVAFEKTNEKVEIEKIEIAKKEYDVLGEKSKKLKESEIEISRLNSKLENIRKAVG